jgi:hypothetical protein
MENEIFQKLQLNSGRSDFSAKYLLEGLKITTIKLLKNI